LPSALCSGLDVHGMHQLYRKTFAHTNVQNLPKKFFYAHIYVGSLAFKSLHVDMVLCNTPKFTSLLVGSFLVISQGVATGSSFVWRYSVAEVFAADDADKQCVCYYSLGKVHVTFAMLTPCLVLATYLVRWLPSLRQFFVLPMENVPYNLIQATSGEEFVDTLLVTEVVGHKGIDPELLPTKRATLTDLRWHDLVITHGEFIPIQKGLYIALWIVLVVFLPFTLKHYFGSFHQEWYSLGANKTAWMKLWSGEMLNGVGACVLMFMIGDALFEHTISRIEVEILFLSHALWMGVFFSFGLRYPVLLFLNPHTYLSIAVWATALTLPRWWVLLVCVLIMLFGVFRNLVQYQHAVLDMDDPSPASKYGSIPSSGNTSPVKDEEQFGPPKV